MITSETMALYDEIKRELEDVNFVCSSKARTAWRGAGYYEVEPTGGRQHFEAAGNLAKAMAYVVTGWDRIAETSGYKSCWEALNHVSCRWADDQELNEVDAWLMGGEQ